MLGRKAIDRLGERLAEEIVTSISTKDAVGFGPAVATGQARDSIKSKPTNSGFVVVSQGAASKYIETLETGRKPGTPPPIAALKKWVEVKGLAISPYALQKSIAKDGTLAHQKGRRTDVLRDVIDPNTIGQTSRELAKEVGFEIVSLITKAFM